MVSSALYDFAWHEYCDWYLELTKAVLNDDAASPAAKRAARATLAEVLGALLKLLHPLIPFVTEELWLELCAKTGTATESIMLEHFPEADDFAADAEADSEIAWLKGVVVGVRQIRGESNLARSVPLTVKLADTTDLDRARAARHLGQLRKLAGVTSVETVAPGEHVAGAATALAGGMRILVPLAGLIDVAGETDRLTKQRTRAADDLAKTQRKMSNESFVANAPPDVVAKERERMAELEQKIAQLTQQIERLAEIA